MCVNPIKMVYISSGDIVAFLPLFFVICAVIMVICFFIFRFVEGKNDALPMQEETAKIIDLRQESVYGIITVTRILFELSEGKRVRFVTDMKNDFLVGDTGVLQYKGERLISFERGNTKELKSQDTINNIPKPQIEVTQEEIQYVMQKRNIPYGEAALLVRKIKIKQWEKRRDQQK